MMMRLVFVFAVISAASTDAKIMTPNKDGGAPVLAPVGSNLRLRRLSDQYGSDDYYYDASSYQQQINKYKGNYNAQNYYAANGYYDKSKYDSETQEQENNSQQYYNEAEEADGQQYKTSSEWSNRTNNTKAVTDALDKATGRYNINLDNTFDLYQILTIFFGVMSVALMGYVFYLRRKYIPARSETLMMHGGAGFAGEKSVEGQANYKLEDTESPPPTGTAF